MKNKSFPNFYKFFLALPLAFVGVPIYLNISDFYALNFDINLAVIGICLIFIRIFDALQDILIGGISDKIISQKFSRGKLITIAASSLIIAFYLVFNPPENLSKNLAVIWFCASLCLTYTCFNFCIINFESMIAIIASNDKERIKLNSIKEFLGLIGLILAFILPTIFLNFSFSATQSYASLSLVFAALIIISLPPILRINLNSQKTHQLKFFATFSDKEFLIFMAVFLLNSIAVSLPAANLIFYVRDVLLMEKNLGYFLGIYFLCAGIAIIFWKNFAEKNGLVKTWIIAISGSIITFYFAYFLDENSANYFYLICLLSGFFLGGDLIIPPALLAKISSKNPQITSSYFAMWNMITKFGLMIAASSSLIFLGNFGYVPGVYEKDAAKIISIFYAAIPCLLKIIVAIILMKLQKTKNLPSYEN